MNSFPFETKGCSRNFGGVWNSTLGCWTRPFQCGAQRLGFDLHGTQLGRGIGPACGHQGVADSFRSRSFVGSTRTTKTERKIRFVLKKSRSLDSDRLWWCETPPLQIFYGGENFREGTFFVTLDWWVPLGCIWHGTWDSWFLVGSSFGATN